MYDVGCDGSWQVMMKILLSRPSSFKMDTSKAVNEQKTRTRSDGVIWDEDEKKNCDGDIQISKV